MSKSWEPLGKSQVSRGQPIQFSPIFCLTHPLSLVSFKNLFCLILVSTTKLNPLELVGGSYCPKKTFLYGQWCVAGPSVLAHTYTPLGSTFILTCARGEETTIPFFHFPHAERWGVVFTFTILLVVILIHNFGAPRRFPHHQSSKLGLSQIVGSFFCV